MFTQNPHATPIWLLIIFSAVSYFGYPRIKRFVSKYISDKAKQSFYAFIILLVIEAIVVTLSIILGV